ncbi:MULTISPECIES: hypothetical protein [Tepidanaerobacter]|uniref:hypothetical protein n=1 Tax=Tepidanaerobacter TaxID=499228 RepID=UPI001BD569F2|nr:MULTISPECIES: hypothetical protein [Tepidanaerobacter]
MSKDKGLKPGQKAPKSGQYEVIGPKGGHTGKEITAVKNEPLPPTDKPNQTYDLADPTKNKSGK